jgi:hypothetical protein
MAHGEIVTENADKFLQQSFKWLTWGAFEKITPIPLSFHWHKL